MTTTERQLKEAQDRIRRLERTLLELQHENAELRYAHKTAFAALRESAA